VDHSPSRASHYQESHKHLAKRHPASIYTLSNVNPFRSLYLSYLQIMHLFSKQLLILNVNHLPPPLLSKIHRSTWPQQTPRFVIHPFPQNFYHYISPLFQRCCIKTVSLLLIITLTFIKNYHHPYVPPPLTLQTNMCAPPTNILLFAILWLANK